MSDTELERFDHEQREQRLYEVIAQVAVKVSKEDALFLANELGLTTKNIGSPAPVKPVTFGDLSWV